MVILTQDEKELSGLILAAERRPSGTVWVPTVRKLASMLGVPEREVGAISVADRGVIGNRLCTPGVMRTGPDFFLVDSMETDYTHDALVARIREYEPLTRHLRTVLIARPVSDPETGAPRRRVTDAVVIEGVNRLEVALPHFPALSGVVRLPLTPLSITSPAGPASVRRSWMSREPLPDAGVRSVFLSTPASSAPAVGETVVFTESDSDSTSLSARAYGRVSRAQLTSGTLVTVEVSDVQWLVTPHVLEESELMLSDNSQPNGDQS